MSVGVPKETMPLEKRVAQTPDTVSKLVKLGITVNVEAGAGEASKCSDDGYKAAGAKIVGKDQVRVSCVWCWWWWWCVCVCLRVSTRIFVLVEVGDWEAGKLGGGTMGGERGKRGT